MKFFIDTANIEEIKKANELGLLDGVTTNPSLVSKEGREFKELIKEICGIVNGPVSAEVISTDSKGMIKEARELAKLADNIVVKIPLIKEGLKAVKILSSRRHQDQRNPLLFAGTGIDGGQGGGQLCEPLCRQAG